MFDHRSLIALVLAWLLTLSTVAAFVEIPSSPGFSGPTASGVEPIEVEPDTRP